MEESLLNRTDSWIIICVLGVFMALASYIGYLWGLRKHNSKEADPKEGNKTITSSIFAITGFLLAFTFNLVGTRYEMRRENIVKEATAIGTAYMRSDLYPQNERIAFQKDFRDYVEARIGYFDKRINSIEEDQYIRKAGHYGNLIWQRAARLAEDPKNFTASNQMVPAVNDMLDMSTIRYMGEKAKLPEAILLMLFLLLIISSFFSGYIKLGKEKIDKTITLGFCLVTILVVYAILDLDRPRRGFIRLDVFHQTMIDLKKQMQPAQ